jgi:hypothetical protein
MNLVAGRRGHRDQPALVWMLVLPLIPARPDLLPSVVREQFEQVSDLHAAFRTS